MNESVIDSYHQWVCDLLGEFSNVYFKGEFKLIWFEEKYGYDLVSVWDYVISIIDIQVALINNVSKEVLFEWFELNNDSTLYQYINIEKIEIEKKELANSRKQILKAIKDWIKIDLPFLNKLI